MKFNAAHPMKCVYLKHGAYWLVKQNKWERLGETLAEALAAMAERVEERKEGKMPEFLDRALAHHYATKRLADRTKEHYTAALKVLKRKLRKFDPKTLKGKHVARVKLDMAKTPNHANRMLSLLRVLMGYAVEWGEADNNPAIGITRYEENKRKRYLTDGEFSAIHAHAGARLKLIMDLQYLTGQRITDVLKLHRKNVTPEGLLFKPKKTENSTGAMICVRWTDAMRVTVAKAYEQHGDIQSLWVFGSRTRKAPDYRTVAKQFFDAAQAAGIEDARPNDQRAKSLTDTDNQGKNATALAVHSDPQMTARYLRLFRTVLVDGPSFGRNS